MPTILITGASRGIGAALAKTYRDDGWTVLAACRNPDDLEITGVEPVALDVTDDASLSSLVAGLDGHPIDILWNNAGVYLDKNKALGSFPWSDWSRSFETNTIAPIRLAQALSSNLEESEHRVMAFTTSRLGSLALCSGDAYAYRSSKAALNMAVRCLSFDMAPKGITCVLIHPGWVKTDMGGPGASIDVTTSATGMKTLLDKANPMTQATFNGRFFNYDGTELPW